MIEQQPDEITLEMMRTSLYSAVVCDALDGLGYRNQSPRVPLAALTSERVLVGRCKTTLWGEVFHTEENPYELELEAVDGCLSDDVLICAAGGSRRSGVWGELLSTAARNRGCVGAIVDGGVRDVAKMRRMDFPVFARSTCVYDSAHRQRVVAIDVPIEIDRVTFAPGDLVIADVDGVVVVPRKVEQQAIARAWEKVHAEDTVREAIAGGMKAGEAYRKYGVL